MDPIRAAQSAASQPIPGSTTAPPQSSADGFAEHVRSALRETNRLLVASDRAAAGVADGSTDSVEAVLALSRAEIALRHVVSMTTRALEAYREVMRLQL